MNPPVAPATPEQRSHRFSRRMLAIALALATFASVALLAACADPAADDSDSNLGVSRSEPADYTQAYVQAAIDRYEEDGLDAAVEYYNSDEGVDGQWYMFIADGSGHLVAHGADKSLVGEPLIDVTGENGYPSGLIVSDDAAEGGAWSDYIFYNPASNRSETKHSWVVKQDGLIFGSGWYEAGPGQSNPSAYTQSLVQQAINLYDSSGLDAALEYYNTPISRDGQWYVFIIDTQTGRTIGHYNPDLRDRDPALRVDSTGYFYGDELLGATEGGRWLNYVIRNPETDRDARKNAWTVLHDGYIFASGWYE